MISLKETLKAIKDKISNLNTSVTTINTSITTINSKIPYMPTRTLLWTNPNPDSSFAAQTIDCGIEIGLGYKTFDMLQITYKKTVGEYWLLDSFYSFLTYTNKGEYWTSTDYYGSSLIYVDDSCVVFSRQYKPVNAFFGGLQGVVFNAAQYAIPQKAKVSDNTRCVPYKIYGIHWSSATSA